VSRDDVTLRRDAPKAGIEKRHIRFHLGLHDARLARLASKVKHSHRVAAADIQAENHRVTSMVHHRPGRRKIAGHAVIPRTAHIDASVASSIASASVTRFER
jgi:hypothetical protein